jgi:hypothetical protein
MRRCNTRQIAGWMSLGISTLITCFWAFWGIVENFHEGWYFVSPLSNLGLMFVQYLSPMLVFMGATLVSIFWPRFGGGLYIVIALLASVFFQAFSNAATFVVILPLMGLGLLYWLGRIAKRKVAISMTVGLPLLTLIIAGIGPAIRVSQRIDDGNLQARAIHGNGVDLIWAPDGPGWPRNGVNWYEAQKTCRYLDENGVDLTRASSSPDIWRLPTAEEAVRSMSLHGINSQGMWNTKTTTANYATTPDKESPLWNVHSQIIYWWTATEIDQEQAYIIVYDGKVWPRTKLFGPAYLGFRCVKSP